MTRDKKHVDDLFDRFDVFAEDPEKYYNNFIFENFNDVLNNDDFRESIVKHNKKKRE